MTRIRVRELPLQHLRKSCRNTVQRGLTHTTKCSYSLCQLLSRVKEVYGNRACCDWHRPKTRLKETQVQGQNEIQGELGPFGKYKGCTQIYNYIFEFLKLFLVLLSFTHIAFFCQATYLICNFLSSLALESRQHGWTKSS